MSGPESAGNARLFNIDDGVRDSLAESGSVKENRGKWVLITRKGTGSDLGLERRELTDEQARVIGRILTNLQRRLGYLPEIELPVDEKARKQLKTYAAEETPSNFQSAQLVSEPLPGMIRRSVWIVPRTLVLLLGLGLGLLFGLRQGVDLLLQAEEGLRSASLVGLALVLIPSVLLAALAQSVSRQNWPDNLGALVLAACVSGMLGLLVGFMINAISIDPFGLLFLPMLIFFAALGFALCLGCGALMEHPFATMPVALGLLVAIGIWPAAIGDALGSLLTLAVVLTAWAFLLSALVYWYRRAPSGPTFWTRCPPTPQTFWLRRQPTTKLLGIVFAAVIFAMIVKASVFDSPVDTMRGAPGFAARPFLDDAFAELVTRQTDRGEVPVVVIVAAAGGGIKASYWTSKVLGQATDRAPQLADQMLVASGVSGGSLGLTVYRGLLQMKSPQCEGALATGPLERCAEAFHRSDLLAGVVGALGTAEVFNAFLPVFPRRSIALEQTWEARWRRVVRGPDAESSNLFGEPFRSLWANGRATPALILNTTRALSGDRIVVSNVNLSGLLLPPSTCDANIAEHIDLPLSTAANASARFPIVEPWGWFPIARPIPGCNSREAIADGGFYDNYGAATALDVYRRIKVLADGMEPATRIVVVQISSDVDCRLAITLDQDTLRARDCEARRNARQQELALRTPTGPLFSRERIDVINYNANWPFRRFFYRDPEQSGDPPGFLGTAMNSVSLTGLAVASELRNTVIESGDDYFYFSLGGALDIPLGWALSRHARTEIDMQLLAGANARELDRLVLALAVQPAQGGAALLPSTESER